MAAPLEVKEYLAKWLQMGKALSVDNQEIFLTEIIKGESYSSQFEQLWQQTPKAIATLQGTNNTIAELLKPEYEIMPCPVCELPVACLSSGYRQINTCPCSDLPLHPHLGLPLPHVPIATATYLQNISDRLR